MSKKLERKDYEKIGRIVTALAEDRVLTYEEIKDCLGLKRKKVIVDLILKECLRREIIIGIPAVQPHSYILYPHVSGLFNEDYGKRIAANRPLKRLIADYVVASMVFSAGVEAYEGLRGLQDCPAPLNLIVDAGTSTQAIVRRLTEVTRAGSKHCACLYTVNVHAAMILANSGASVVLPRGKISPSYAAIVGDKTAEDVAAFPRGCTTLLGTSTINSKDGFTSVDDAQIPTKRAIAERGLEGRLIIAADHTKVGPNGPSIFAPENPREDDLCKEVEAKACVVIDELPLADADDELVVNYSDALSYLSDHFYHKSPTRNRLHLLNRNGNLVPTEKIPGRVQKYAKAAKPLV